MTNENSISKERQIINEILEKVNTAKDKRKITKKLWISEKVYGRDNQAAVGNRVNMKMMKVEKSLSSRMPTEPIFRSFVMSIMIFMAE